MLLVGLCYLWRETVGCFPSFWLFMLSKAHRLWYHLTLSKKAEMDTSRMSTFFVNFMKLPFDKRCKQRWCNLDVVVFSFLFFFKYLNTERNAQLIREDRRDYSQSSHWSRDKKKKPKSSMKRQQRRDKMHKTLIPFCWCSNMHITARLFMDNMA